MNKKVILSILIVLFAMAGCFPCLISYEGMVADGATGQPLDSVTVKYYQAGVFLGETLTDETGEVQVSTDTHHTGLFGDCDELKVEFTKSGFTQVTIRMTSSRYDTIRMFK